MKSVFLTVAAVITVLVGCHRDGPPSITITDTRGRSSDVPTPLAVVEATELDAKACARLEELQCSDAKPRRGTCRDVFRISRTNEVRPGEVDVVSKCVASSPDVPAVRRCGSNATLTFACP